MSSAHTIAGPATNAVLIDVLRSEGFGLPDNVSDIRVELSCDGACRMTVVVHLDLKQIVQLGRALAAAGVAERLGE